MSSLYSSKFPLPPANYENNSNVICRPWQLPGLFEKSLRLQDHISDRACRHVAFEPKNKLACNNTMHLKHELDRIPGDVKALRCNVGMDNATVVSFYSILDAKHCYAILKHKLSPCYQVSYVKPAFVYKSCQANSAEKLFLIFSSISARVDLLDYDYMKHIARFGSIYSISEARISRQCIIVNVEYHDERHGDALKANLNCAFIEGAQIMVYSATYNDEIGCTFASSSAISGKGRPIASSLSIDTTKKHMSRAAPYQPPHPPLATLTQSSMVATPLPSPVAEGESYFTVDPYLASKYHPVVSSLPPSPVALQHDQEAAAHPKPYASAPAPIDTSPSASASSNTTFGTCLSTQEEGASYAAAVVQSPSSPVSPTPSPPQITTTTNTTATTTPESSSCSNPTPSPSPTTRPGKKVAQNHPKSSSEEKLPATASSTRNSSSRRKRQAPSSPSNTKKAACNSVDFAKIQSGQDKRTTFMIRNIPNKYTQQMLIDYVNATHEKKYDFLYLRIDFQNKCNVGYAFINFIDPKDAVKFAQDRVGKKWQSVCPIFWKQVSNMFKSDKKCDLSYANIQGKQALIKKFQNSQVLSEDAAYQPKLFYSSGARAGQEQPWPSSNNNHNNSSSSHSNANKNRHT